MRQIKGITFAPFGRRNTLNTKEAKKSFDYMIKHTGADFVILAPVGWQAHAHAEKIEWNTERTFSDEELIDMIRYAKAKGIRVGIKPTVNCLDGTWRAFISFFEHEVVCEPKWCNWFQSYKAFQMHYAQIAQKEGCEMFIAGCEMVMTEHREQEWRDVIAAIRQVYHGLISYNTDKYQEDYVKWWDCVDVISSSGYYPAGKWEQELDRIERVVRKYKKPFFFAEAGCMSREGSKNVPNDWGLSGNLRLQEQTEWYEEMFAACQKRDWVSGFGLWEWAAVVPIPEKAKYDSTYQIGGKPVQEVIRKYYKEEKSPFETIQSEKVKVGRFTVVEDQVRVNEHEQPYDYLEIREGVSILAISDGKIIVQRQYRYPVRSWQWEIPGGFVDDGEIPQEAAIRELKEETGYDVKEIYSLGAFHPSFGSTNEKIHLFAVECGDKGEADREPGEMLYVEEMEIKKFQNLIASGEFMHGAGLAAWARYCERIKNSGK